ncbi:hypothetical protein FE257_006453 [Aspergillus nanangensis]|uniref:Uncharacterized protein n=1 Tax=Aspergillus nanangensis TaxID=2582783 RepID=A0AAD4H0C5_ASPNN|nr:hypothetical protein FE257_006453 [Aspergillus nanangensis]
MEAYTQDLVHQASLDDPKRFWDYHAKQLHWFKPYSHAVVETTKTLPSGAVSKEWSWFPDGELSTSYNCIHRHIADGGEHRTAILWESMVTGRSESWTYGQLRDEVEYLSGVLQDQGVKKGDIVLIYMPTIPAALIAALAIVNLGAVHAAVFGGFAAKPLAERIDDAKPRVIMTASCAIEGTKGPISYRQLVESSTQQSRFKPERVLVWDRDELPWGELDQKLGQRDWRKLVNEAKSQGNRVAPVPVRGDDDLYIIYTSGTTSAPKGVVRPAGGHAVALSLSVRYLLGICGPGDVIFCTSDIGWVVGHSYILYAPLLVGATTLLYEGKPVGPPDAGVFWRLVQKYQVNVLSTSPTALRAICKEDPAHLLAQSVGAVGGLKSLRGLFVAGERSEPEIIHRFQDLLSQYGATGASAVDNWWSSETGSPITGLALNPDVGLPDSVGVRGREQAPVCVGSAGRPMPGFDVRVVDDDGKEVSSGKMGNLVLGLPLGPTAFTTLFNNSSRFYHSYLQRFNSQWLDTGDVGVIDTEGYIHVLARSDDVINVAAYRFSTSEIEQAILLHPQIVEATVVGIPDPLKGHLPLAFVELGSGHGSLSSTAHKALFTEVNKLVRDNVGAVASLGGIIQGEGIIPKTRSGKVLRRTLRELVENGTLGKFTFVKFPPTIENPQAVENARLAVRKYFEREREVNVVPKL